MKIENENKSLINPMWLVIIPIVYIMILVLVVRPYFRGKTARLFTPIETKYYDSVNVDAIALKDEKVFNSGTIDSHLTNYEEGTRVPFGIIKAGESSSEEIHELQTELNKVEEQILMLNQEISNVEVLLRTKILFKDYIDANSIIDNYDFSVIENSQNLKIDELVAKKDELKRRLVTLGEGQKMNPPGLISYKIDGFENYSTSSFYELDSNTFDNLLMKEPVTNSKGNFKIIDNFKCLFAFKFDDKNFPNDTKEKFKKVKLEKPLDDGRTELDRKFIQVKIDNENVIYDGFVVLDNKAETELAGVMLNEYIEQFYTKRKVNLEVIFKTQDAFKIPTKSITTHHGVKGVCVKDIKGIVQFRRITILGTENEYTYVLHEPRDIALPVKTTDKDKDALDDFKPLEFCDEVIIYPQLDNIYKIYGR